MEDVVRFVQNFVALEYEVMIQIRSESDIQLITTNLNDLDQFFQGLDSGLYLSSSRMLEERSKVVEQLQPRVLFRIEQYDHPTLGTIYRVYLSSPFRGDQAYFTNFYIADTEKGLKIIARYTLCHYCKGTGNLAGILCDDCNGVGWDWRGGQKIEELGELIVARQFAFQRS